APGAAGVRVGAGGARRMPEEGRALDWEADPTGPVMRRLRAAEGHPGVLDTIGGESFHLFGAHREGAPRSAPSRWAPNRWKLSPPIVSRTPGWPSAARSLRITGPVGSASQSRARPSSGMRRAPPAPTRTPAAPG